MRPQVLEWFLYHADELCHMGAAVYAYWQQQQQDASLRRICQDSANGSVAQSARLWTFMQDNNFAEALKLPNILGEFDQPADTSAKPGQLKDDVASVRFR